MTDLDRLLELEYRRNLCKECCIMVGLTDDEEQEYQSLYEKLKTAEEFFNDQGKYDGFLKAFSWLQNNKIAKISELEQNQKTADDIEKYDRMTLTVSNLMQEVDKREKEIQQLKDIIQIKFVQEKLLAGILECTLEELPLKIQSSKANAEKLELIEKLGFHTMPIPQDSTSFASFSRKQNKLQSILKEKPQ